MQKIWNNQNSFVKEDKEDLIKLFDFMVVKPQ